MLRHTMPIVLSSIALLTYVTLIGRSKEIPEKKAAYLDLPFFGPVESCATVPPDRPDQPCYASDSEGELGILLQGSWWSARRLVNEEVKIKEFVERESQLK